MNVGFFYGMNTYPPTSGGTIHGYQLVRQLVAQGHTLQSWYFGNHNDPDVRDHRGRELLSFLRSTDLLYIRIEWATASAALSLLGRLRPKKIPVVWEFNGTPDELLFAGHSRADIQKINRRIGRWARYCAGAIGVTDDVSAYVRDTFGIPRVITVANGSDPELFYPRPKDPSGSRPLEVVWLGTSRAGWHDLPCLLDAARILEQNRSNVKIRILGDKAPLAGIALPSNVTLEGAVPYTQLADTLSTADVGIHLFKIPDAQTSVKGSPLKVFDYMACGLAVVVNCDGQQADIIEAHHSGIRCEPSASGVAQALVALERDRARCAELGANGRAAVVSTYNWRHVGKATSEFLSSVLAEQGR